MYVYVVVREEINTRTLPLTYKNTVEQHIACFAVIGYSERPGPVHGDLAIK